MTPNNCLKEYIRAMNSVSIDDEAKQRIIKNCARRSTLQKIKSGKFKIIAVKKEKTAENI